MGNPSKLWIPAEKLDENVKRMAWLMFLEAWKAWIRDHSACDPWKPKAVYAECLQHAKMVRQMEQPKTEAADVSPD